MERTFIMIKPDGIRRRIIGEIISRFERKGLYLVQSKIIIPTRDLLEEHYSMLKNQVFFNELVEYMQSGQVMPMVWEGKNAVNVARTLIGVTNPQNAAPGTIRGDYGITVGKNSIHGSDSLESAEKEIELWFGKDLPSVINFDKEIYY